jgi:hypothetical protein
LWDRYHRREELDEFTVHRSRFTAKGLGT